MGSLQQYVWCAIVAVVLSWLNIPLATVVWLTGLAIAAQSLYDLSRPLRPSR